jgi:hypothetical protein
LVAGYKSLALKVGSKTNSHSAWLRGLAQFPGDNKEFRLLMLASLDVGPPGPDEAVNQLNFRSRFQ